MNKNEIIIGDCKDVLKKYPDESIDCIVTDPPYGYSFMGLSWDKVLPSPEALTECCRVLKPGAFGFFMCAPRQDVLSRMIIRLEDAGFNVNFSSMYHTYSSGFPKSQNVSKVIDRRAGAEREVIGVREDFKNKKAAETKRGSDSKRDRNDFHDPGRGGFRDPSQSWNITLPATPDAKKLDGSYGGMQLKPAVEIIIVCMKPLSEKTYVDQALANGKGVSWLNDCRIPSETPLEVGSGGRNNKRLFQQSTPTEMGLNYNGRFPANLLVSDDVLNNGIIYKSGDIKPEYNHSGSKTANVYGERAWNPATFKANSGSFSRYFDLDAWFASKLPEQAQKTYPYLIVPKPAKSEKNKYIENKHPTVKPLKLMSYLITMGSREGDLILDPFAGSGTTLEACTLLNRWFVGIDIDEENRSLMEARGQLNTTTLETFHEIPLRGL